MYLPNALYERAPRYWLFVGLLLVVLGLYLGVQVSRTFLVVGVALGLASCAWGVRVMLHRASRPGNDAVPTSPPTE